MDGYVSKSDSTNFIPTNELEALNNPVKIEGKGVNPSLNKEVTNHLGNDNPSHPPQISQFNEKPHEPYWISTAGIWGCKTVV